MKHTSPTCHPNNANCSFLAYNGSVPTPFYHLSVAYELLEQPALSNRIRNYLIDHRAAFLLGKTAPDVQVMSGQKRHETHFYTIPPGDATPAWKRLLEHHPVLGNHDSLPPEQVAFLAGYSCHLQADEAWLHQIFLPVFGPNASWDDFHRRLYLHNILRAYLDRGVLKTLPTDTGQYLQGTMPSGWLPFVEDAHLEKWRDFLTTQLQPGAHIQTVDVFAGRHMLSLESFYDLLDSEPRMDTEIFSYISRHQLSDYRQDIIASDLKFLQTYLAYI
jgi:hypothetical protein